jgi:hypothetical protein
LAARDNAPMTGRGFTRRFSDRRGSMFRAPHLLSLIAMAMACGACLSSAPTPSAPSQASLAAEPEASLQSPESTELQSGGFEAHGTPEGPLPSVAWRRYGTGSAWQDVVAFFDAELRRRGWAPGGGSSGIARSTEEFDVTAWNKDDRIVRLSHRRFVATDTIGFGTYYEVTLIGQGLQCCATPAP